MQSTVWLLLWASVWNDTTLVITLDETASQYQALFTDLESPQGYDMYQGVQSIESRISSSKCAYTLFLWCWKWYTQIQFQLFPDGANHNASNITTGNGEVVNIPSSEICFKWMCCLMNTLSNVFENYCMYLIIIEWSQFLNISHTHTIND